METIEVQVPGFVRTLHIFDGERVCAECGGASIRFESRPGGSGQMLVGCLSCFHGVQQQCRYCGGWSASPLNCRCKASHYERRRALMEDEIARFDTAQHLTVEEAEAVGIEYIYWPGNDGEYLDRLDEIADTAVDAGMYWRDSRPLFAWATREERIALSAENIIEAACEGLHNEAAANIPAAAYEELQKNLDAWCEKYGEHTTTYYPDYTRAILAPPPEPDSDREADYAWPWGDADA